MIKNLTTNLPVKHLIIVTNFNYKAETILDDMPDNVSVEDITKTFKKRIKFAEVSINNFYEYNK